MASFFKKTLGKFTQSKEKQTKTPVSYHPVVLKQFLSSFQDQIYELEREEVDQALTIARLSDLFRSLQTQPPSIEELLILTDDLDEEEWRRFALFNYALENKVVKENIRLMLQEQTTTELTEQLLLSLAKGKPLLPLELLGLSHTRLEEFARSILAQTNTPIKRESFARSQKKLQDLDYERLLGEAERAKEAAAEQLEELRKIQEEERNTFKRSKW